MKIDLVATTPDSVELEEAYQHLYNLEHRRADALAAISAASREIATSPDLPGTLRLVMDKAAQTLPMDAGVLFLLDQPSQRFEVAISNNLTPQRVARITFALDEGGPASSKRNRPRSFAPRKWSPSAVSPLPWPTR